MVWWWRQSARFFKRILINQAIPPTGLITILGRQLIQILTMLCDENAVLFVYRHWKLGIQHIITFLWLLYDNKYFVIIYMCAVRPRPISAIVSVAWQVTYSYKTEFVLTNSCGYCNKLSETLCKYKWRKNLFGIASRHRILDPIYKSQLQPVV